MRLATRRGEYILGAAVLACVSLGLLVERAGGPLPATAPASETGKLFVERALFCPTLVEGMAGAAHVATGPTGEEPLLLDIEPGGEGPEELEGRMVRRAFRQPSIAQVISYGGFAAAGTATTFSKPREGLAAAPCSNSASRHWYFAQGSSDVGFNEFLVLYNPFPDEAVVRVQLLTPQGVRSKANLSNVAVPSGQTMAVRLNEFIRQERVVGAQVDARRGRIVAWKTIFAAPDRLPGGAGSTLGALGTSTEWFFPSGNSGGSAEVKIAVLNPTEEEAVVTVSLVTNERVLQPEELVGISIPRRTVKEFVVTRILGRDVGPMSVIVRSDNGVGVVAERSVWYQEEGFSGYTVALGAPLASGSWWLPPAASSPDRDAIVLLNVGPEEATVTVDLLLPKGAQADRVRLDDVKVPAGGRARLALEDVVDDTVVAIVRSSAPIVAERVAHSAFADDVAAVLGIAIE